MNKIYKYHFCCNPKMLIMKIKGLTNHCCGETGIAANFEQSFTMESPTTEQERRGFEVRLLRVSASRSTLLFPEDNM